MAGRKAKRTRTDEKSEAEGAPPIWRPLQRSEWERRLREAAAARLEQERREAQHRLQVRDLEHKLELATVRAEMPQPAETGGTDGPPRRRATQKARNRTLTARGPLSEADSAPPGRVDKGDASAGPDNPSESADGSTGEAAKRKKKGDPQ